MVVAATGFFDGVHIGHQAVIRTLLDYAEKYSGQSLVISFWPHPRVLLQKDARQLSLLTSIEEKKAILEGMGVQKVEILQFTRDFAAMSAERYLAYIKEKYGVEAIVLGYDNRFGSGGEGTQEIADIAGKMGFTVLIQAPELVDGITVSSTQCRLALKGGNVELASKMLGRDYSLSGVVVAGKQLGRSIGFPTANLRLREPLKCVPATGVYLSRVGLDGQEFWGMSNVDSSSLVETHIFDFDRDIYGMDLEVIFVEHIRSEIHFNSVEELKNQLKKDEMSIKKRIFAGYDHKERR
ncbi:MAG: riboflavin biosynthesis protein RibF [Candidatus Cryptobacteroides sp.]